MLNIKDLIKKISGLLMWCEIAIHLIVFMMLIVAAVFIILDAITHFSSTRASILNLLDNALLLLVIKEIIWTVLRFLRHQKFTLSTFFYVGVISAIREILFLSIQNSMDGGKASYIWQILANSGVVFLLVLSYYLFKKARIIAGEES